MNVIRCLTLLVLITVVSTSYSQAQDEKKLTIIPVKYDGLKQEVLKHRGKVVLVDFWAGY